MILNQKDLDEFRQLWVEEYGEELSEAEARRITDRIFTLYKLLARPLPSEIAAREALPSDETPKILYRHDGEQDSEVAGKL